MQGSKQVNVTIEDKEEDENEDNMIKIEDLSP